MVAKKRSVLCPAAEVTAGQAWNILLQQTFYSLVFCMKQAKDAEWRD